MVVRAAVLVAAPSLVAAVVIPTPVRFSIVAAIAGVDEAELADVRATIEISDPVLSKQSAQLEAAGHVKVRTGYVGERPRTWLSLTPSGRAAYTRHIEALCGIAGGTP